MRSIESSVVDYGPALIAKMEIERPTIRVI